jgi:hypothetical protein
MALALDPKHLAPASLLFRPAFLERAAIGRHCGLVSEIIENIGFKRDYLRRPLFQILDEIYQLLVAHYQCEYVFKNAVASAIRSHNRGFKNVVVMDEFRASDSRADVVAVNGTSIAYEVKTDLDSLDKLSKQLDTYQTIFDEIWVATTPTLCSKVIAMAPPYVGIAVLGGNMRLKTSRKAASNRQHVSPEHIFDCMRREEYVAALRKLTGTAPAATPARMYTECKQIFRTLAPDVAHAAFVSAMKSRAAHNSLISNNAIPSSLTYLCLTTTGSGKTMQAIERALMAPCV